MILFKKKKEKVLQQDLGINDNGGHVFIIQLLMEEACEMPDKDTMSRVMAEHLGDTECFSYSNEMAGFSPKKYKSHIDKNDVDLPAQLVVLKSSEIDRPLMDDISLSQLWNCPDADEILDKCKYHVVATDMLSALLDYKDRSKMLVAFVEALAELYPSCKAFVFGNSNKMITRDEIINCDMPEEIRFIYYAVNVRFFNVEGTSDMLVDTLGMSTICMPDLQYHFHDMDPNEVVNHAYNMVSYMYDSDNPIKPGDLIDGVKDGEMSTEVQWEVQYESALIQPSREVIDINMGEYASGVRKQTK
ncbi:DUF4261 domain-containing protein [Butyrivibrio sp. MC2013]|uniref:DUF4261 domain-containing protein n=1 Tax=Butyrivibrio sp. MC2013 TaxID=1280686 RepID=UPI00047CF60F|nr:DUF4261 domain-containing protein [Butyrivibrio sp. MC2013]